MPAYSFKKLFVPFVEDGTKPHTIRKYRKYPAKKGDTLYLYYGLRTIHVRKLRQELCTNVETIAMAANGKVVILIWPQLKKKDVDKLKRSIIRPGFRVDGDLWGIPGDSLNDLQKDQLAWKDGFRPEGTTLQNPAGAFDLMLRFWRQTHELPFVGNLIHWKPSK